MFTTPGEFQKYLQGLIGRHESDLSIILNSLGIASPPTPERLVYAYEKFPIRFTQLLGELNEDFMNATGDPLPASVTGYKIPIPSATAPAVEKQSFFDKLFSAGKKVISTVNQVKAALPGQSTSTDYTPTPEEEKKITTKKILIIGAIIVVVLVVTIVLIKKFKK
jgi:hypothetical protein